MEASKAERELCKALDSLIGAANEELGLRLSDEEQMDRNLADAKARDAIMDVVKSSVRFKKHAEWHLSQGRGMKYCIKVEISANQISSKVEHCEG